MSLVQTLKHAKEEDTQDEKSDAWHEKEYFRKLLSLPRSERRKIAKRTHTPMLPGSTRPHRI